MFQEPDISEPELPHASAPEVRDTVTPILPGTSTIEMPDNSTHRMPDTSTPKLPDTSAANIVFQRHKTCYEENSNQSGEGSYKRRKQVKDNVNPDRIKKPRGIGFYGNAYVHKDGTKKPRVPKVVPPTEGQCRLSNAEELPYAAAWSNDSFTTPGGADASYVRKSSRKTAHLNVFDILNLKSVIYDPATSYGDRKLKFRNSYGKRASKVNKWFSFISLFNYFI